MSEIPAPELGEIDLPEAYEPTEAEMLDLYKQSKAKAHNDRQEQIKKAFVEDEDQKTEAA